MGFFEDMFMKVKGLAENFSNKAEKLVDTSKFRIELAEEKSNLKNKYEDVGKLVYNSMKSGVLNEECLKPKVFAIDKIICKIEKLEKKIALLKNKVICKLCGCENPSDGLYCSKCGHALCIKSTCENLSSSKKDCGLNSDCDKDCDCNLDSDCDCEKDCDCNLDSDCDCEKDCDCNLDSDCNCEKDCDCNLDSINSSDDSCD